MTTRTEWFRYFEQRSHRHVAEAPQPQPRIAASGRIQGSRTARAAVYALESSGDRPTRKSTRKSANRQKTDVQFRMKRRESEGRPPPQP